MRYPVRLIPEEEGGFRVSFPDIPEALTNGSTKEEALAQAQDAFETALDFYFATKRAVPTPSRIKRTHRALDVPVSLSAKILLYNEMVSQQVRPAELARRLNIPRQDVTRLLNPRHATKIDLIAAALRAVGKSLELTLS